MRLREAEMKLRENQMRLRDEMRIRVNEVKSR